MLSFHCLYSQSAFIQSQKLKNQNNAWNLFRVKNDTILVFLMLTLKIFHALSQCVPCWFWTNKWRSVYLWAHSGYFSTAFIIYIDKKQWLCFSKNWYSDLWIINAKYLKTIVRSNMFLIIIPCYQNLMWSAAIINIFLKIFALRITAKRMRFNIEHYVLNNLH